MPIANIMKMRKMFYFYISMDSRVKNKLLSKQYSCNCSKNNSSISKWCLTTAPLFGFTQWAFSQSKNFEK